jgi:hypothetical protein
MGKLLFFLMSAILRFFIVFYAAAFSAFSSLIDPGALAEHYTGASSIRYLKKTQT